MNQCAFPECENETLNAVVAGCDEHLCAVCRKNTIHITPIEVFDVAIRNRVGQKVDLPMLCITCKESGY